MFKCLLNVLKFFYYLNVINCKISIYFLAKIILFELRLQCVIKLLNKGDLYGH